MKKIDVPISVSEYSTAEDVFVISRCLPCEHSYAKQDDADVLYCRLRKRKCLYMEDESC